MKYIKNDINTYLLYLLMFTAVFITVVSVVFAHGFNEVYTSSNANAVKVKEIEKQLQEKQKLIENTQNDIELLKQRLREQLRE